MRLLITGGAGFIGANFAHRALAAGDEITVDRVDGSAATFAVRSVMRSIRSRMRSAPRFSRAS